MFNMRVLLIKTSSMGDLIHTLPALTDAGLAIPGITFDWVVEESFAEIPHWHPLVNKVIPIAFRRWRKNILSKESRQGLCTLKKELRSEQYDLILDAQGLVKSAFISLFAKGKRSGLDFRSARESFASLVYQQKHTVNFYQHAIHRMRSLFALALGYSLPTTAPDFGIQDELKVESEQEKYLVFLHGTTWVSKQWPESYWIELAEIAHQAGYRVKISGGNDEEVARAFRIGNASKAVDVMPRLTIAKMAALLANAKAVVAVDTGFGHLAAALNIPTVSLFGPTNADYTGVSGRASVSLSAKFSCAPCLNRTCTYKETANVSPACFTTLPPMQVWSVVNEYLK